MGCGGDGRSMRVVCGVWGDGRGCVWGVGVMRLPQGALSRVDGLPLRMIVSSSPPLDRTETSLSIF